MQRSEIHLVEVNQITVIQWRKQQVKGGEALHGLKSSLSLMRCFRMPEYLYLSLWQQNRTTRTSTGVHSRSGTAEADSLWSAPISHHAIGAMEQIFFLLFSCFNSSYSTFPELSSGGKTQRVFETGTGATAKRICRWTAVVNTCWRCIFFLLPLALF